MIIEFTQTYKRGEKMRVNRIKLITLMAEKDLKIYELANISGLSRATISTVKSGKSCTYDTAVKIAKALNVPVTDLIAEE